LLQKKHIKATKDEVCKIICSILDDLEKKDQPNPHSEGSQIEEGVYSSYLLRKQGNKVNFFPFFLE